MDLGFFGRGLITGFAIAAPVGPIAVLCVRRTLAGGAPLGLASGLGAATADAVYGSIAGFGLTLISGFLVRQESWLEPLGGGFLIYLGIRTFLARPSPGAPPAGGKGLLRAYVSTFLLTLANPLTIISFAAVFSGLGLARGGESHLSAALLVLGVFLGSASWWLLLSGGLSLFRKRLALHRLRWINRISGVILLAFGLLALLAPFLRA